MNEAALISAVNDLEELRAQIDDRQTRKANLSAKLDEVNAELDVLRASRTEARAAIQAAISAPE